VGDGACIVILPGIGICVIRRSASSGTFVGHNVVVKKDGAGGSKTRVGEKAGSRGFKMIRESRESVGSRGGVEDRNGFATNVIARVRQERVRTDSVLMIK
jgi:hypothetical protein